MISSRRSPTLLAALLAAAACTAHAGYRRDDLGPRRRPAVLRIQGVDIDSRTLERTLAEGELSWKMLREMHSEETLLKEGVTKQEFIVLAELAEPLAVRVLFGDEANAALQKAAQDAYERAKAGESWESLVRGISTAPDAAANGGDLGVVAFDNLVHPFNRAMFTAPLGEVQPPVQTVFGWHVGKVTEILAPRDVTRADGSVVRRPETRRVSQILLVWPTEPEVDLRVTISALSRNTKVEVLDRSRCDDFPHWCQPAPEATQAPEQ